MKHVQWDPVKSHRLKKVRGVSFEEIVVARFINKMKHPVRENQLIMLFEHRNYIWLVPYVEKNGVIFLKTLYPSRKYTQIYREKGLL